MNERIKELIEQAYEQKPLIVMDPETYQPTHKIGNGGVPMYHSELNPEKFAELIVREYIGLIRQQSVGSERIGGQWYKTVQLGETIATITEHFGVEE